MARRCSMVRSSTHSPSDAWGGRSACTPRRASGCACSASVPPRKWRWSRHRSAWRRTSPRYARWPPTVFSEGTCRCTRARWQRRPAPQRRRWNTSARRSSKRVTSPSKGRLARCVRCARASRRTRECVGGARLPRSTGVRALSALLPVALTATTGGCASSSTVTRSVRGRLVRGRFVTDDAYAAYLRGALLEAQGNREAALTAYAEGARYDPESPELLTKIGALICERQDATGNGTGARSGAAFDRAAAIDPDYEEAWTERARCHLKRGQLAEAERAARVAVSLDPDRI